MTRQHLTNFFLAIAFWLPATCWAQISFSDQTSLIENTDFTSGVAIAVADMNGDGLDDIIRLNNASNLSIEYQVGPFQPFTHYEHGPINGDSWAIAVADMNNDGYCDIMTGGAYDDVKVLTAMNAGSAFDPQVLPGAGLFVQGANFADINNDGFLDVFSCHDDGESRIWANNGSGLFLEADDWIDMATVPASDNSGNYGSTWTDFDNDGDQDLYIAKCRIGVNDPEDPRRINALFVNDGNNNYTELADKYGLKIKWQSWTSDFQDIDNDGDFDCFVANHDHPLQLLENDGAGHFTDISTAAGIDGDGNNEYVQGIMRDFDNDGFVDIITAQPTRLYRNNGDKTFTAVTGAFGDSFGSLATGDLNHDGFLDVFAAYQNGFNNPSNKTDKLWINNGNSNHFFAVNLVGTTSNRAGVGARIEIHGSWGIQVREVRSGESYGISNSLTAYFGLGAETEIDFAVVRWPSGKIDVVKAPTADQFLTITEGSTCNLPAFDLALSGPAVICPGEELTITAPMGYDYLWSNGQVGQSIAVGQSGNYSVVLVDAQGCAVMSQVVRVETNPDETPTLVLDGADKFCEGGAVTLTSSEANGYTWSNGETGQSISITQTGDYYVTVPGVCAEFISATVHVEVLDTPAPPTADGLTIFAPAAVTLTATGSNVAWYADETATTPLATGTSFETSVITETTTFFAADEMLYGGEGGATGMPEHQGSLFNGNTFNGVTFFEVFEPMTLQQVTVTTDQAGVRIIEVLDANDDLAASASFGLPVGESVLDLNFDLQPGQYTISTNTSNNQAVLGSVSPRLYRSSEGVDYPYTLPGLVSINASNGGSSYYYYFYDWKVATQAIYCPSGRTPVTVTLSTSSVDDRLSIGKLSVSPNPNTGSFRLELETATSGQVAVSVVDLTGKTVHASQFEAFANQRNVQTVNLENIPSGLYMVRAVNGEKTGWVKVEVVK